MENGNQCALCGNPITEAEATIDHIRPLSRGGEDIAQNMQLTHRDCNSLKGNQCLLSTKEEL